MKQTHFTPRIMGTTLLRGSKGSTYQETWNIKSLR